MPPYIHVITTSDSFHNPFKVGKAANSIEYITGDIFHTASVSGANIRTAAQQVHAYVSKFAVVVRGYVFKHIFTTLPAVIHVTFVDFFGQRRLYDGFCDVANGPVRMTTVQNVTKWVGYMLDRAYTGMAALGPLTFCTGVLGHWCLYMCQQAWLLVVVACTNPKSPAAGL